jgi:hypothetical protein
MTGETKRSCRWCRFTACKTAGMAENNVLREKEKKQRFRHAIKKRRANVTHSGLRKGFATMSFGKQTKLSVDGGKEQMRSSTSSNYNMSATSNMSTSSKFNMSRTRMGNVSFSLDLSTENGSQIRRNCEQILLCQAQSGQETDNKTSPKFISEVRHSKEITYRQTTIGKNQDKNDVSVNLNAASIYIEAREVKIANTAEYNQPKLVIDIEQIQGNTNISKNLKYIGSVEKNPLINNKTAHGQRTVAMHTMLAAVELTAISKHDSCAMEAELAHSSIYSQLKLKDRWYRRVRDQMSAKLKHIQHTWAMTLNAAMPKAEFVNALVAMHLGHPELLTKDLLHNHIQTLKDIFQNYALLQPEFLSLSPREQKRLIRKNHPTFVQYMLVGYLSAIDGLTQLSWLLTNKVPYGVRKLRPMAVTPQKLNDVLGLFSETNMDKFSNVVKEARLWSLDECYFFSLACLFNDSCTQELFEEILTLSEWAHDVYWIKRSPDNIQDIFRVLEKAQTLFSDHNDTSNVRIKEVSMGFTNEEELSTDMFIGRFQQAYGCLPFGSFLTKCIYDYADGIPFPPEYGIVAVANTTERLHRVFFAMCEDYSNLPFNARIRAMTVNTQQAIAIDLARAQLYDTFEEQVNHYVIVGALPKRSWAQTHVKKVTVHEANRNKALMDTAKGQRMQNLLEELNKLVADNGMFPLLVLVLLTNGLVTSDGKNMQDQYLTMFRRRVISLSDGKNIGLEDAFFRCIGHVREIAEIMKEWKKPR